MSRSGVYDVQFLVWYDPDPRRSVIEKIQDARAAYQRKFNQLANLVLINTTDVAVLDGVEVRNERTVQPHHFWVSFAEAHKDNVSQEGK